LFPREISTEKRYLDCDEDTGQLEEEQEEERGEIIAITTIRVF